MKKLILFLVIPVLAYCQASIPGDTSFSVYSAYEKAKKDYPFIGIAVPLIDANITVKYDVVYSAVDGRELHLDLFLPSGNPDKPIPVIVLIHGGGWRSGNKTMEHAMAARLAAYGYAAAAVEYRLSPEAKYPAAIYDLKEAVKWLKVNASEFNIDTGMIVSLGTSAGGTLAALLGTTNGNEKFKIADDIYTSDIHAIIDIDGILDFTHPAESGKDDDPAKPSAGKAWLGYSYKENPDIWIEASPLSYAGKETPPVLFVNSSIERFHAGRDEFLDKIKPFGIYYELHTISDTPHPFWLFHPWFDKTAGYIINFLDKIFKRGR